MEEVEVKVLSAEESYSNTVFQHREQVKTAFHNLVTSSWFKDVVPEADEGFIKQLQYLVSTHDLTMFFEDVMDGYIEYLESGEETDKYKRAIYLHKKYSPHHWEFWVRKDGSFLTVDRKVRLLYLCEEFLDLVSLAKFEGVSLVNYYQHNTSLVLEPGLVEVLELMIVKYKESVGGSNEN